MLDFYAILCYNIGMDNNTEIAEMKAEIEQLKRENFYLAEQLRLWKLRQFGPSSERTAAIVDQVSLFNEAEAVADPELPEPDIDQAASRRRKQKGKREKDFSELPTEQVIRPVLKP
jgi:hypothetical protein